DRMTVNRDRGRDDAKPDPFQSRGFVEVRGELFENGTERHELVMIGGGELAEPKGLDQLVQFFRQLPRGTLGTSELRVRGAAAGQIAHGWVSSYVVPWVSIIG